MNKEQLLSSIPDYYENSDLMANILNTFINQFTKLQAKYESANKQLSYHTADTDLYRWEQDYGIITDSSKNLEERLALLSAKYNNRGTVTLSFLKSLIESFIHGADIIEHTSDYYFDVILKTKTNLENCLENIINQIESSKPCHLDYNLIIDYVTILVMHINFARYNSENLTSCGTIDVSGNPRVATDGRKYSDKFIENMKEYFSNALLFASIETYSNGSLGKSFNEKINDLKKSYFSNTLKVASDKALMNFTDGLSTKEIIVDKLCSYDSVKLQAVSDNNFIYMINGLSKNEKIIDKYSKYFSEPFQIVTGTDGLTQKEYITDNHLSYNSEAFKEASNNNFTYMSNGIRENENIIDKCSMYSSINILPCSNNTYCGGGVYA